MHIRLALILLFFSSFNIQGEERDTFLDQEISQLSFYMGYLIGRDHAKNSYCFPTKFDQLVEGMKAGVAGDIVAGKKKWFL